MLDFGVSTNGEFSMGTQVLMVVLAFLLAMLPVTLLVAQLFRPEGTALPTTKKWDAIEVGRSFGYWPAGFLAFVLEALRAAGTIFLLTPMGLRLWAPAVGWDVETTDMGMAWVGAFALLMGHCFNPFLRFQGGRGIAAIFGAFAVLSPFAALAAFGGASLCALKTRKAELSSLVGLMSAGLVHLVVIRKGTPEWIGILLLLFVAYRHHRDVDRLLQARESSA
jgi:glycerol-3-phosphate acyltransferase PlsY